MPGYLGRGRLGAGWGVGAIYPLSVLYPVGMLSVEDPFSSLLGVR